jgi:hypothetical protein
MHSEEGLMEHVEFDCPHCGQGLSMSDELSNDTVMCPECGQSIAFETPALPPPPIPLSCTRSSGAPGARLDEADPARGILRAGWICFGIGATAMVFLFLIPVWGFLFLAAGILGIVAMTRQKTGPGLALLLSSIFTPVLGGVLMTLLLVGATCAPLAIGISQAAKTTPRPIAKSTPRPSPPAASADPTATPTARRTLTLAEYIKVADSLAAGQPTRTMVQQEAAADKLRAKLESLTEESRIKMSVGIRNVRMHDNNHADIYITGVDDGGYTMQKDRRLTVLPGHTLRLKMTRAQAMQIQPGQTLHLTAECSFISGYPGKPGTAFRRTQNDTLCTISLKDIIGSTGRLGDLAIKSYSFSVVPD